MASLSLRLMLMFMFAALVLNVSNYLFVRIYNAAGNSPYQFLSTTETRSYIRYRKSGSELVRWDIICPDKNERSNDSQPDSTCLTTHTSNIEVSEVPATEGEEKESCPELPPGLGPEQGNRSLMSTHLHYSTKAKLAEVKMGGIYQPSSCKSLQSVAIIIAYRGCKTYLNTFMIALHMFLIKQQLEYQIFVVEQTNKTQAFNRGKLLNVGFTEATRYRKGGFHCIIFHEPHIVPVDSRNLYRCGWYPRQLAIYVERPVKAPFVPLLGGAIAFTTQHFLKLNGFSNAYWGNDADYYDLYSRINASNYYLENSIAIVGKYKMIRKGLDLWTKSQCLTTPSPLYLLDGLTSLTYTVDSLELRRFFTYLQVTIDAVVDTKKRAKMYDKLLNPTVIHIPNNTSNESSHK